MSMKDPATQRGHSSSPPAFRKIWQVKYAESLYSALRYASILMLASLSVRYLLQISQPTYQSKSSHPPSVPLITQVCESPECVHAASNILYNLHPNYANIDPCDNFDEYVCGGWKERHDMRPDQGSIFAGTIMAEDAQTRLRRIMELSETPDPADIDNFRKLKAAYNACLDESTIRARGTKPLDDLLVDLVEIYSPDCGQSVSRNLTDAIVYLMRIGTMAFVELSVSPDDRDPDSPAIFATPPREIGLPAKESYNDSILVADYTAMMGQVLCHFDSGDAKSVVELETQLANVSPNTQAQEDVTQYYNPLSIEETESLLPEVSFRDVIAQLAPSSYKGDRLIVGSPSYMKSLSGILNETPRRTIQLFLKWKMIQSSVDKIEDSKLKPLREFNNRLAGKDPMATEDRWRTCVKSLDQELSWILSRFYILDSFPSSSKELGDGIIRDIKEQFIFNLDHTSWMSPTVRKLAIEKVGNIIQKIGYPTQKPNILDAADVSQYYMAMQVSNDTFFENGLAATKFEFEREWSKLGSRTDRAEWGMTAPTVNAYYSPTGNEIVFPAGIMQPPVFDGPNVPLYLAYGAFGAVAGHELSHAFDSSGRQYDQTGNYTDWWDEETTEEFEKRAQCFVDQYSKFTVHGSDSKVLHVNGRLTLGENIADAGGIRASFHAWKKHDNISADRHLPGLSRFSKDQLFFISYGNWWCSKTTPQAAEQAIYTDPHAPKPARILGTMANSQEFKEAFGCATTKPVCRLW